MGDCLKTDTTNVQNRLENIPSGVDDIIAKFVHEPKYCF